MQWLTSIIIFKTFRSQIQRQLIRYFSMDFTATDTTKLAGLSRRSVTSIFGRLRQNIARS